MLAERRSSLPAARNADDGLWLRTRGRVVIVQWIIHPRIRTILSGFVFVRIYVEIDRRP